MTYWLVAHAASSRAPCRRGDPLASSRAPCGRGDPLKKLANRLPRRFTPRNDILICAELTTISYTMR